MRSDPYLSPYGYLVGSQPMDTYIREGKQRNIGGAKKILIALSKKDIDKLDLCADIEGRTRSDVVRHAVRVFVEDYFQRHQAVKSAAAMIETTPACGGNGTE